MVVKDLIERDLFLCYLLLTLLVLDVPSLLLMFPFSLTLNKP